MEPPSQPTLFRSDRPMPPRVLPDPQPGPSPAPPPSGGGAPTRAELQRAVDRGEWVVRYQPIVDLARGRVAALEALVRWMHPRRGLLLPDAFLPQAEETGVVVPMGWQVLREACTRMQEWHARYGGPQVAVSVNLSARQVDEADMVAQVEQALAASGLPPASLILEITETALIREDDAVLARLQRIRDTGVRIALDDFGAGYSGLGYVQRLPVDVLKMDRSFTPATERGRAVLRGVAEMAGALSLGTVAEGVATEAEAAAFREMGFAWGQGFHFAHPLTSEDAGALLYRAGLGFGIEAFRAFLMARDGSLAGPPRSTDAPVARGPSRAPGTVSAEKG